MKDSNGKKIWIDLDNSPHVPFFSPIIKELNNRGYQILLTARDCSQTCGIADLFCLNYLKVGRHYGKRKILKVAGTIFRALQLSNVVRRKQSALAISHGSRAQMFSAFILRIPSVAIMDYEHTRGFIHPDWVMMPEVISFESVKFEQSHILTYPGIKEDVYVPTFKPDARIRTALGVTDSEIVITIRPPATEAHYHNPESEKLFTSVVEFLGNKVDTKMIIVPRNGRQSETIKEKWGKWFIEKKIVIPETVVDGLNLIWHSDLVISGGGTMNREAAALGVPVYSIFRGKIGAVDRYLSDKGRLVLLENAEDVKTKISLTKRVLPNKFEKKLNTSLNSIIDNIVTLVEN